jgi:hypothetical protein
MLSIQTMADERSGRRPGSAWSKHDATKAGHVTGSKWFYYDTVATGAEGLAKQEALDARSSRGDPLMQRKLERRYATSIELFTSICTSTSLPA